MRLLIGLTGDSTRRGADGAEDSRYLSKTPPYHAANQLFTDVGELLLVHGFDQAILVRIAPYLSTLPATNVKINVNTCHPELLRALPLTEVTSEAINPLIEGRGDEGYSDAAAFLAILHNIIPGQGEAKIDKLITVQSEYFTVKSTARFGNTIFSLLSLLKRGKGTVAVIQRRRLLL